MAISPLETVGLFERHSSLENSFPRLSFHTYLLRTIPLKGLLNKYLWFLFQFIFFLSFSFSELAALFLELNTYGLMDCSRWLVCKGYQKPVYIESPSSDRNLATTSSSDFLLICTHFLHTIQLFFFPVTLTQNNKQAKIPLEQMGFD